MAAEVLVSAGAGTGTGRVPFVMLEKPLALDRTISYGARQLYTVLKALEGIHGCFPSMETLAYYMDTTIPTVRRFLNELVLAGWVERQRRGLGKTNTYSLTGTSVAQDKWQERNNPSSPDRKDTTCQEAKKTTPIIRIRSNKTKDNKKYSSTPPGNTLKDDSIVLANASVAHTQEQEAVVAEQENPMQSKALQYALPLSLDEEIVTNDQTKEEEKKPITIKATKAKAKAQPEGTPLTPEQKQAKALLVGNAKRLFKPGEIPSESHKYGLAIRLARQFPLDVIERNVYHLLQRPVIGGFGIGYLVKAFKEDYEAAASSSSMNERMMAQDGQQRQRTAMASGATAENPKNPENFPRLSRRDTSAFAADNDPLRTTRGRSQRQLDTWNGDNSRSLWNKKQSQAQIG